MDYRILLVEDEELIGEMVQLNLHEEGNSVTWLKAGNEVLPELKTNSYDLVILDVMLPGANGFEVAKLIRDSEIGTPILMLTARSGTESKVQGLDAGADDYLTKPFEMAELLARVRALIRRSLGAGQLHSSRIMHIGASTANLDTLIAQTPSGRNSLSEKEAGMLGFFAENKGLTLSRADILEEVWGMDSASTQRTVDNFIVRLRKIFEPDPENPQHIITVRSKGYRFEP